MSANDKQVAGGHYQTPLQHWDYVVAMNLDYFQAQITKYVTRCWKKNGIIDLRKASHFLEKYRELCSQHKVSGTPKQVYNAAPVLLGDYCIANSLDNVQTAIIGYVAHWHNSGVGELEKAALLLEIYIEESLPHKNSALQEDPAEPGAGYTNQ